MQKYNTNKIIKVAYNEFTPSFRYQYRPQKKFFGIEMQREGIYEVVFDDYLGTKIPENYTLISNTVYKKPHVMIYFEGGFELAYYFQTEEEASRYMDELTSEGSWI